MFGLSGILGSMRRLWVPFAMLFVVSAGCGTEDGGFGRESGGNTEQSGGNTDPGSSPVFGGDSGNSSPVDATVSSDAALFRDTGSAGPVADAGASVDGSAGGVSLKIFFVGNSYTHRNLLPGVFTQLAKAAGIDVVWDWRAPGGSSLGDSYDGTSNHPSALPRVQNGNWDYVVMQEQSTTPLTNRTEFLMNAMRWDQELDRTKSKGIFLLTWARKAIPETQAELTSTYTQAAVSASAMLAPAGEAWKAIGMAHPELDLYAPDGSHPSILGTYLAACTLYSTISRRSPEGLPSQFTAVFSPGVPLYGQATSGDLVPRKFDIPTPGCGVASASCVASCSGIRRTVNVQIIGRCPMR